MINEQHKDRLFRLIFGREENRAWTLNLYNAVNGTDYGDDALLEFNTMDDAVYMGMKNDLSFLVDGYLSVYGHQSSTNPNLPLRGLLYLSGLYNKYVRQNSVNLYGKKRIMLPVPRFIVFYNGLDAVKDEYFLHLSDAFPEGLRANSDAEIVVRMLNINYGRNREMMEKCEPLREYAWFVDRIRDNRRHGMELEPAVDAALDEMPKDYLIRYYLVGNRSEVKMSLLTEYNEAETMELFKRDFLEEGIDLGQENVYALIRWLKANGRGDKALAMVDDDVLREQLFEEMQKSQTGNV